MSQSGDMIFLSHITIFVFLSDITAKQEVENAWNITLNIPHQGPLEITEAIKTVTNTDSIIEQDDIYVPVKVEIDTVDYADNPGLADESEFECKERNNDSDTSSIDNADIEGVDDIEQDNIEFDDNEVQTNAEQESSDLEIAEQGGSDLDFGEKTPKRRRGRPRKSETNHTPCSKLKKKQEDLPTFEEFKELVKGWPMYSVTPQNVAFGTYLKPIEKPDDLDDNFYSKSENGYFCCNCSILFKCGIKYFMKHRLKTDGKCYYECDICDKKFNQEGLRSVHFKKVHSDFKPHVCDICGASFKRKDKLNIHMQQHHSIDSPFVCELCPSSFKTKKGLYYHNKIVHVKESEKLLCSICPKTFKARSSLDYHLKTHDDKLKNDWHCDQCDKSFRLEKLLKRHIVRHSQERRFCCDVCGKRFYQNHDLKIHYVVHTGQKPYECDQCQYKCNVKWNLDKHMNIHRGKRWRSGKTSDS